jgi:hypothetical protein
MSGTLIISLLSIAARIAEQHRLLIRACLAGLLYFSLKNGSYKTFGRAPPDESKLDLGRSPTEQTLRLGVDLYLDVKD